LVYHKRPAEDGGFRRFATDVNDADADGEVRGTQGGEFFEFRLEFLETCLVITF